MQPIRLLLVLAAFLATSCASSKPDEHTEGAPDQLGANPPAESPAPAPTSPAPLPSQDAPPDCSHLKPWCDVPIFWPGSDVLANYPNETQQCYCPCDVNGKHLDCADAPLPNADCGVIMNQVTNPDGSIGFVQRFPTGFPLVCRYSMIQQAF